MMENGQRYTLTLINVLTVIVAMGVIVALIVFLDPSRESTTLVSMLSLLTGSFITQNSNSQQWWFGTTKGTSDTTGVLRDLAVNAVPASSVSTTVTTTATPPAEEQ